MSNRLAKETSPYLLQHAHNPVDWYAWGPEAFARARDENKPILLSIGYSACHWCHVMERESFENAETARIMNDMFVNMKVDREERPDVDSIYMQAVQAMTGHGGWPMTTFLTPQLEPFWGGTYFPPDDRPGMPSFTRVLRAAADAYHNRSDDVERVAASMREMYSATRDRARSSGTVSRELLDRAARGLLAQYDSELGGFGDAPKFPHAMAMEFLLQQSARARNAAALDAVVQTFRRMARGGIYDQVGGGFARYSVDGRWRVPHFEKMLYDNALLTRLGVHLFQATKDADVRMVVIETIAWLEREMTSPEGGFYSSLDADSEGEEGTFYLWSESELRELLGRDADPLIAYWGVTAGGNFEGRNILNVQDGATVAADTLMRARKTLYAARATRIGPARDEKILASWNGLMLRAVADAARVFDEPGFASLALRNGEFLFRAMVRDGACPSIAQGWRESHRGGFLEDHAALGLGAIALYELTFDRVWLERARALADATVRWFWDDAVGAFFDTATDHEELLTRPRDLTDNATPSGTSLAIELLLRLGDVLGDADMLRRANAVLETVAEPMARYPLAFGHALMAADAAVFGIVEVAVVGNPSTTEFGALTRALWSEYVPTLVVAGGLPRDNDGIALLQHRELVGGNPTAYLCRGYVCDEPTVDPGRLAAQLKNAVVPSSDA